LDKSKPLMITIIALLVILLGAISFASFYFVRTMEKNASGASNTLTQATHLSVDQIEKVSLSSPISTNLLNGKDGVEHYVKINLSVGVNNTDKKESPRMLSSLKSNEMVVRDIVLAILRNQTYEELTNPDGQDLLKDNIKTQLQDEFKSNLIVQVYISDLAFS